MKKAKGKLESLCVTQIASGTRCKVAQVLSLRALGLGRIGKKSVIVDNNCTRGMIKKVSHLVRVEDSNG